MPTNFPRGAVLGFTSSRRWSVRAAGILLAILSWMPPAMARTVEFDEATVADLNAAFEAGTLSSERLVELCLARIRAYDRQGPSLHAMITVNPKALETARALDAERKSKGPRSPLHGIPVILKDNYDTMDLPTTGGSVLLEGSIPPDDAFVVTKLRAAGAIILGKANMSEFASPPNRSSLGGQSLNPHDLERSPAGSSSGTGVAIAAGYAPLGMGTDTGGSIRGPSAANGIVGLKPTHGLLSRNGIIPLALSFDTGGPMTRSVYDAAAMLSVMTGVDPADEATKKSAGKIAADYTKFLKAGALKGARIGIARDFMGFDTDVDWTVNAAIKAMEKAGATVVEVRFPTWFLSNLFDDNGGVFMTILNPEFKVQLSDYLAHHTGPKYPKSMQELLQRSYDFNAIRGDGVAPNPARWADFEDVVKAPPLTSYEYQVAHDHGLPMMRALVEGMFAANKLDAIVYPTSVRRPGRIEASPSAAAAPPSGGPNPVRSATSIANLTGFPDLIVPAGFTGNGLPVGLSFFGLAFSEPKLFALGYSFEQATKARRRPVHTPALQGATVEIH